MQIVFFVVYTLSCIVTVHKQGTRQGWHVNLTYAELLLLCT